MNEQQTSSQSDSGNVYAAPAARVDDVTPEGEMELAGRGSRLIAAIIDGLIVGSLAVGTAFVSGFNMFTPTGGSEFVMSLVITIAYFVWYLVVNGYFLAQNGQTVGKKIMGIKIARKDGSKADLQRIITMRLIPVNLISLIPFIGGLIAFVGILLIFRESRQCLHDTIADTVVFKV